MTIVIAKRLGAGAVRTLTRTQEEKGLTVQAITPWDVDLSASVELVGDVILVDQIDRVNDVKAVIELVKRAQRAGKEVFIVSHSERLVPQVKTAFPDLRRVVFP